MGETGFESGFTVTIVYYPLFDGVDEALDHLHLRYGVLERPHEAGYDAFLTAQVFLALAAEMSGRGKVPVEETWLVNQKRSTSIESALTIDDRKKVDVTSEKVVEPPFEAFSGGIFDEWMGLLSINGTMEGFVKLDNTPPVEAKSSDFGN